jgi:hypothetical protein
MGLLADGTVNKVLPEFQEFLLSHKPAPEKNIRFYAHWVSRFLSFLNRNEKTDLSILVPEFLDPLRAGKAKQV